MKSSGLMSHITGVRPLRTMAWVVEANVKGVVITSPFSSSVSKMHSSALCPFTKSVTCRTLRYSLSRCSSSLCLTPAFVMMWLSHSGAISAQYSSNDGIDERVT